MCRSLPSPKPQARAAAPRRALDCSRPLVDLPLLAGLPAPLRPGNGLERVCPRVRQAPSTWVLGQRRPRFLALSLRWRRARGRPAASCFCALGGFHGLSATRVPSSPACSASRCPRVPRPLPQPSSDGRLCFPRLSDRPGVWEHGKNTASLFRFSTKATALSLAFKAELATLLRDRS